jgi:tryptophan-rich sensory protein
MLGKGQFSLGYLFLATFWVALAVATTRSAVLEWTTELSEEHTSAVPFLAPLAVWFWSIAIGGLFGRMTGGAAIGFLLFWLLALVLGNYT